MKWQQSAIGELTINVFPEMPSLVPRVQQGFSYSYIIRNKCLFQRNKADFSKSGYVFCISSIILHKTKDC